MAFVKDYDGVASAPISATQYRFSAVSEHQTVSQWRKPCINLTLFFRLLPTCLKAKCALEKQILSFYYCLSATTTSGDLETYTLKDMVGRID